jgi:hypothetical protein
MSNNLAQELATYAAKLTELQINTGKFVLIKGSSIEGIFDSYGDALKFGYEKFKLEPFLVKQISTDERVLYFTRELNTCH